MNEQDQRREPELPEPNLALLAAAWVAIPSFLEIKDKFRVAEFFVASSYECIAYSAMFWLLNQVPDEAKAQQFGVLIVALVYHSVGGIAAGQFALFVGRELRGEE